jgi:hypothetical protein
MPKAEKWVCVHGHFYQPPRENPWTGLIERQLSAAPFHDWNQRIDQECYRANTAVAVMSENGMIERLVNNYAHMSWNMGPTLLAWMQRYDLVTYHAIIAADRASRDRFGGHGSAMAQAYSHVILPLANRRDKTTQVKWGIADFRARFNRLPEGMWLPECAVDTHTLEVLAEQGIAFTVLAPHQAKAWRATGESPWNQCATSAIDTGCVYRCPLPSGRSIDIFFYDGATAQAVAFERLLADGARFAERLTSRGPLFGEGGSAGLQPPLCHIATDGESYGHHHRFGDMALAWTFHRIEQDPTLRLTNYAEYRTCFVAQHEVQIVEDSSWSCAHGTMRWREDCGCNSGGRPGWKQHWRRPLRNAFEWLRDQVDRALQQSTGVLLTDPWAARDECVQLLHDDSDRCWQRFVAEFGVGSLTAEQRLQVRTLMQACVAAQAMFTSCGWFFDDVSGIETIAVIRFAAHAAQLLSKATGDDVERALIERLALVPSNDFEEGNGKQIWHRHVESAARSGRAGASTKEVETVNSSIEHELELLFERFGEAYPGAIAAVGELPTSMRVVAQTVLRRRVTAELQRTPLDAKQLQHWVDQANRMSIALDGPEVAAAASRALVMQLAHCESVAKTGILDPALLESAAQAVAAVRQQLLHTDLFVPRAITYRLLVGYLADWRRRGAAGELHADARARALYTLATSLGFAVQ